MNAMILAAGKGERLRPHTEKRAKPSIPFLNIPLIGYSLYYLEKLGIDSLVVNTHHAPDSVRQALRQLIALEKPSLQWTFESPDLLGSGGGIKLAEPHLRGKDQFLVANGDELMLAPKGLDDFWQFHLSSGALASLLVCHHEEVGKLFGGVWVNEHNQVLGFGKKSFPLSQRAYHYTGFIALADRAFDYIPQGIASNLLYDDLTKAIQNGEDVRAFEQTLCWYETGNEKDFLHASIQCLNHLKQEDEFGSCLKNILHRFQPELRSCGDGIWKHQNSNISSQAKIRGPCMIGKDVMIDDHVTIDGNVIIGDGTTVAKQSYLQTVVLGQNVTINPGQIHKNCLIL